MHYKTLYPKCKLYKTFFRLLVGKEEQQVQIANVQIPKPKTERDRNGQNNFLVFVLQILSSYWKKSFTSLSSILSNCSSTICPHKDTCLINSLKVNTFCNAEIHLMDLMSVSRTSSMPKSALHYLLDKAQYFGLVNPC